MEWKGGRQSGGLFEGVIREKQGFGSMEFRARIFGAMRIARAKALRLVYQVAYREQRQENGSV